MPFLFLMALLKRVKKETLRKEWRVISLVFAQLVVVILIVFQALQIAGLHIDFYTRQIVVKPIYSIEGIAVLAIALALFALLYLDVKRRQPALYNAQKKAPGIIKQQARQKLGLMKSEPQAAALLFVEFLFVAVLVLALRAYLDPGIELIPWSRLGIGPPFTTGLNAVIAIIVLAIFYYLYNLTKPYRKQGAK